MKLLPENLVNKLRLVFETDMGYQNVYAVLKDGSKVETIVLNCIEISDKDVIIEDIIDFEPVKDNFIYKGKCLYCEEDMKYIKDKSMEALGWISMDCPKCTEGKNKFLYPRNNPTLTKVEIEIEK